MLLTVVMLWADTPAQTISEIHNYFKVCMTSHFKETILVLLVYSHSESSIVDCVNNFCIRLTELACGGSLTTFLYLKVTTFSFWRPCFSTSSFNSCTCYEWSTNLTSSPPTNITFESYYRWLLRLIFQCRLGLTNFNFNLFSTSFYDCVHIAPPYLD